MKTNVNLEFINEVRELSEKMQRLTNFWTNNEKELEDVNECKGYPFSESFEDLTFNVYNWLLTLINDYCEKDPNTIFEFFNAYYKTLQK
ncbi:MAG: hypothetical protein EOM05_09000 [Clostridia bacterium]|nr:hypothetical protein [Clostridia bacterium]